MKYFNICKYFLLAILITPTTSIADIKNCLFLGEFNANCNLSIPEKIFNQILNVSSIKKDEFTTKLQHDKLIKDEYDKLWNQIEDNGYLYFTLDLSDKFNYNPDNQRWESKPDLRFVLYQLQREKEAVFGNAYRQINGKTISIHKLLINDGGEFFIPMSSSDARLLKNNGRILIAAKKLEGKELYYNDSKINATIKNPQEIYYFNSVIPYEVIHTLIYKGKKLIYGYNHKDEYGYELNDTENTYDTIKAKIEDSRRKALSLQK